MSHAAAEALAAGLPRILVAAERLAFTTAAGQHGRRRPGPGETFWQFRDWQNGDDAGRIDWRRSAQGERYFLKDREQEAQTIFLVQLDDNPGMGFQSMAAVPPKRDRAILLLLALSSLLLRAGERVALAGFTPPLTGKTGVAKIAQAIAAGCTAPIPHHARRIRFGDFLNRDPVFAAPQGGAVLQILDPAECDFPYRGRIRFEHYGTNPGPGLEAADAAAWRETYLTRLAARRAEIAAAATRAGQTAIFHRTDAPPATALTALYRVLQKS